MEQGVIKVENKDELPLRQDLVLSVLDQSLTIVSMYLHSS